MADVLQGKFCGECHGKVAFPPTTACERCHVTLPMAPGRAKPDLLGTLRMQRTESPDEVAATLDSLAATAGVEQQAVDLANLPTAVFPHWVHRIRYKCKACHMSIFEPRAGANEITMNKITAGESCGTCHNGKVAFAAGFGQCQRCHQAESIPDTQ